MRSKNTSFRSFQVNDLDNFRSVNQMNFLCIEKAVANLEVFFKLSKVHALPYKLQVWTFECTHGGITP